MDDYNDHIRNSLVVKYGVAGQPRGASNAGGDSERLDLLISYGGKAIAIYEGQILKGIVRREIKEHLVECGGERIKDSAMANPEDRIRDLIMNIEDMKMILDDIQMSLEDSEEYDNAAEAMVSIERAVDSLDSAFNELEDAAELLELQERIDNYKRL